MTTTPNNGIKFSDLSAGMEEVIRLDKEGFHYRDQFIADAGEAHRLLVEYLKQNIQPEPEGPTDEVAMLVLWLRDRAAGNDRFGAPTAAGLLNRAAELLERLSPPQPVPVSERLPGPEDCDGEGRCWWGRPESDDWSADWTLTTQEAVDVFCAFSPRVYWLPATALPLPGEVE